MTKLEREFHRDVSALGCIVCLLRLNIRSECDIHHILRGTKRKGEMFILGLCPSHHRNGQNNAIVTSRHPWKKVFEARYGTEEYLLERTRRLVADRRRMETC